MKVLFNTILLVVLSFVCNAQFTLNENDVNSIQTKAELLINKYELLLNSLGKQNIPIENQQEIIDTALIKIFQSEQVPVNNALILDSYATESELPVIDHLKKFSRFYLKDDVAVELSTTKISDIYIYSYEFVLLYFTATLQNNKSFELVAEVEIEKYRNEWKPRIVKIGTNDNDYEDIMTKVEITSEEENEDKDEDETDVFEDIVRDIPLPNTLRNNISNIKQPGATKRNHFNLEENHSGTFTVPVKINGVEFNFVFDTGASSVCISISEAIYLLKNGRLAEEDLLGMTTAQIANGEIIENTIINIRELEIFDRTLYNVEASIINNLNAPLLLGQSVIQELGKIEIDYRNNTLTILE